MKATNRLEKKTSRMGKSNRRIKSETASDKQRSDSEKREVQEVCLDEFSSFRLPFLSKTPSRRFYY